MSFHIHPARTAAEIQTATSLITAYVETLDIDLAYQDFSTEIESMPGKYAPPEGDILLAIDDSDISASSGVGEREKEVEVDDYNVDQGRCKKCERDRSSGKDEEEDINITSRVLGCVALRPLSLSSPSPSPSPLPTTSSSPTQKQNPCELKRLYVHPSARGRGIGRALLRAIIAHARTRGYTEMRLDTLSDMRGAMALYRDAGFEETEAYYETPVRDTVFFALRL